MYYLVTGRQARRGRGRLLPLAWHSQSGRFFSALTLKEGKSKMNRFSTVTEDELATIEGGMFGQPVRWIWDLLVIY